MSHTIFSGGVPIPKVDNENNDYFLFRLILLYGPSATGKSALILSIMNGLRRKIPLAIICSPTAANNGDYDNVVPSSCIYDDLTKPLLQRIFQRQTNVMTMYNLVRDPDHIRPLYQKIADSDTKPKIDRLDSLYRKGCRDIKNAYEEDEIDATLAELTAKYNKKLVKIMRKCIIANIKKLKSLSLTDLQKTLLRNMCLNPNILLIGDDIAANIRDWKDLPETKQLFFNGRHLKITTLLSMQSESIIPPFLRANAHISIFTTKKVLNTYYAKASSGSNNDERKRIARIGEDIFADSDDKTTPNYKKVVVFGPIVPTEHKVQYMIGTPKKKRFGSAALWTICNEVQRDISSNASSASFTKMFAMKSNPSLEAVPN